MPTPQPRIQTLRYARLQHAVYGSYPPFGWNLEQYLYFGGYPGSAPLIRDEQRWKRYILDSLIETTFKPQRKLLVGGDGITLEAFLSRPVQFWVKRNNDKKT